MKNFVAMPTLTEQDKKDIIDLLFITGELNDLLNNGLSAKTIERLLVLKMELQELNSKSERLLSTINRLIEAQKEPPVDGV